VIFGTFLASYFRELRAREVRRMSMSTTLVNKGRKQRPAQDSTGPRGALLSRSRSPIFSEVAELARLEPVQHQLEGLGANSSGAGEGMVHGGDGEQYQRDHPR
jgi:hypothetical protein